MAPSPTAETRTTKSIGSTEIEVHSSTLLGINQDRSLPPTHMNIVYMTRIIATRTDTPPATG